MHKRRLNEFTLHFIIEPNGPLLIKSGKESGADPTLPEMNFVRSQHPRSGQRTIYLPGSSLKGAIRSHVERIIRTLYPDQESACCDPLSADRSCVSYIRNRRNKASTAEEYKYSCLACRLFGDMVHASHFLSADAYPIEAIDDLPTRMSVAINRFSSAVARGPFEIETATKGYFLGRFTVVNFEVWQLGVLALALRDLAQGRLLLGFGKSRGLGNVSVVYTSLELAYPGKFALNANFNPQKEVYGVASLAPDLIKEYGLVSGGDAYSLPVEAPFVSDSLAWGRPAAVYGLVDPEAITIPLDKDAIASNQKIISDVLRSFVSPWGAYKLEARYD